MRPWEHALVFLISTIFDLYLFVLTFRLLLAFSRSNYFNPLTQFIIKLTQPIVAPVRRVIPNYKNFETATFLWMLIITAIKITLITLLVLGGISLLFLVTATIAGTIKIILSALFWAILIQAILSWVQQSYSPIYQILDQITAPVLNPIRRIIPPIGGFDFTPLIALIGLQALMILIP